MLTAGLRKSSLDRSIGTLEPPRGLMKTMPATQVAGIFTMGFVRGDSPRTGALFPVSPDVLLSQDDDCRVIDAFIGSLDLVPSGFGKAQLSHVAAEIRSGLSRLTIPNPNEKPVDVSVY